jgi:hypothetical protein
LGALSIDDVFRSAVSGQRDRADLLQDRKIIATIPYLRDLTVLDPKDN